MPITASAKGGAPRQNAPAGTHPNMIHGHARRLGSGKTSEWKIWTKIKERCLNPNCPAYPDYGGRGIALCARWMEYSAFLADMGPRPSPDMCIDRINNDKGYSPDNCRWATAKDQANNRRSNRHLVHDGRSLTISQWADRIGINQLTLGARLRKGWSINKALTTPLRGLPSIL